MTLVASDVRRPGEPLTAGARPIRSVPARSVPPPLRRPATARDSGRWLLGSAFYSLTLGYGTPRSFFAVAPDTWPGDPAIGQRLLGGELAARGSAGPVAPESDDPPWQRAGAPALWLDALNGFGWLRDLRDCGDPSAAPLAARLVDDWTNREWRWSPITWRREVLAERIVSWIRHYDWLATAADPGFAARFVFSLGPPARASQARAAHRPGRPRGGRRAEGADLRRPGLPARRQALREEPRADADAARPVREALRPARRHRGRARAAPAARGAAPSARRARSPCLGRAPRAGRADRRHRPPGADAALLPPRRRRPGAVQRRLGGRPHAHRPGAGALRLGRRRADDGAGRAASSGWPPARRW